MANTFSKIGITTGQTVEPGHVTQSVDAFTGIEEYDIFLSGSFNMTGSINGEPGIINQLTASYAMNAETASFALNAGSPFPFTGSAGISGSLVIDSQLTLAVGPGSNPSTPNNNTFNVGLGYQNLQNNTTGTYNIALGYDSLLSNTTGLGNIALGYASLRDNTIGSNNIALGLSSLQSNIDGTFNISLGENSLLSNTTGSKNISLGNFSLENNTSGNNNIAIGDRALQDNTTGLLNISIGNNTKSDNYSGLIILGNNSTATANNQLVLGSSTDQIGPLAETSRTSNRSLEINLNGEIYEILLYKP
jgi:hypothetical protein